MMTAKQNGDDVVENDDRADRISLRKFLESPPSRVRIHQQCSCRNSVRSSLVSTPIEALNSQPSSQLILSEVGDFRSSSEESPLPQKR